MDLLLFQLIGLQSYKCVFYYMFSNKTPMTNNFLLASRFIYCIYFNAFSSQYLRHSEQSYDWSVDSTPCFSVRCQFCLVLHINCGVVLPPLDGCVLICVCFYISSSLLNPLQWSNRSFMSQEVSNPEVLLIFNVLSSCGVSSFL